MADARPGAPARGGVPDSVAGLQRSAATPSPALPSPPPIRRDHEVPAVTGELHNSTTVPAVPEFGAQRTARRRRRGPGSRSSRSGPVSTKTSGGTVVTFPPQSAPSWSDPSTTIADRDPLNQPLEHFRPVEIGPSSPGVAAAEAPADTGLDQGPEADLDSRLADHDLAERDMNFATETAPVPATLPRSETTEPPTLFPESKDQQLSFDESQRLFSAQTTDVAPDRLTIHFSKITGPLPSAPATEPEGGGEQPPSVMDLTDSLSDTGHIAEDHDGQPDRDESKESDQELDALLAELSAVSDSSEPEITPPQPPENFSELLKPPSVLSPQDTAVIYGLPGQPTDTPVAQNEAAPTEALPRVGPRRVVPSKQPGQQPPHVSEVPDDADLPDVRDLPNVAGDRSRVRPKTGPETGFEDAPSSRPPISPPGAPNKQPDQVGPPPSREQQVKAPDLSSDKASAEVFGSETSVFPAIKTRRGDIVQPGRAEGSWFTRSAELPYIRVEDSEAEVVQPRRRWLRYTFLVLLVLAIAAAAIIVALQPFGTLPFLSN